MACLQLSPQLILFYVHYVKKKKPKQEESTQYKALNSKSFHLIFDMMLAMRSDGSTPILQIQCDPLGNGCERILHTATEKTKTNFTG